MNNFSKALFVNFIWINVSEVCRYFVFIMPMMRSAFPSVEGIAGMDIPTFMVWGVWDTVLVFVTTSICWLYFEKFGCGLRRMVQAGLLVWSSVFVIFWLALFNMSLASIEILAVAWPLSCLEILVAAAVVKFFFSSAEAA